MKLISDPLKKLQKISREKSCQRTCDGKMEFFTYYCEHKFSACTFLR
jgi:hypothetical protein